MEVITGKVVRGYELHELIGAGGFGAVYRAFQPLVKRDVAIKIILPQYANQPDFIRSFEMEAQLVARLEHIHIVPLYDYWREPNSAYLVMRWLRGGSLRNLLQHGPLPLEQVSEFLRQIAGALMVAHHKDVVHRDIKPDNILLDDEQNVYLTDFGIAQDMETANPAANTSDQLFSGSLTYTSPEQIRGERTTPLTDIYSLGLVLYEMITGEHPFPKATPPQLVFKHLSESVPSVLERFPDMSPEIDLVIQRATSKNPEDRFTDTLAMTSAFRRAVRLTERGQHFVQLDSGDVTTVTRVDTTPTTADLNRLLPEVETPYKGLRPFQTADASDFFGREALVEQLVERLGEVGAKRSARILAVVGPSGSGKSSLVKAGLLPALHKNALPGSDSWFIVDIVPGNTPFDEIVDGLLSVATSPPEEDLLIKMLSQDSGLSEAVKQILPDDDNSQLVLFIDQFEEIFTLLDDEQIRAKLFNALWTAVTDPNSRLIVILTLRADFYDRPLMYPRFGELMRQRTEVVLPLKPEELERAIVQPASQVGVSLEPGLIAAIVADVSEQPGALPLVQYALTELFERRAGHRLTLDAYEEIGGVLGALARRAEELFNDLDKAGQQAARQLFLRLVVTEEGNDSARRRVLRNELESISGSEDKMAGVIDEFGKYRLLTFDRDPVTRGPTVEVAHEALIREWTRLRGWLEENREDLRQHQSLTLAAEEWHDSGHDDSFLARGSRLAQFEAWLETTVVALNEDERSFLLASVADREQRTAAEIAQREREEMLEQRSRNRLRTLVAVLLVATVAALGLTAFALNQSEAAQIQAQIAQELATEARSLALAARAQLALQDGNSDLALLLALEANQRARPTQAQLTLAEVDYSPGTRRRLAGHHDSVSAVAISPDSSMVVSAARDNEVILWDAQSGAVVHRLVGHFDRVTSVAFSPDGTRILTSSWDGTARLWDVATGVEIQRYSGHADGVLSVAFSPGGRTMLTGANDRTMIQWDVDTGEIIRRFEGHEAAVTAVAYSPNSGLAVSGSMDRTVRVWNVTTGRQLLQFEGHDERITTVAFHPGGNLIASGSTDNTARLWSQLSERQVAQFGGHTDGITQIAFDPTGQHLLSASWDGSMILWDVEANQVVHRFLGHEAAVNAVAISQDGMLAVSGSQDQDVRIWALTDGAEMRRLRFYIDEVNQVALSADASFGLAGGNNNSFVLWDMESGTQTGRFFGHEGHIHSLALSPDGEYVLSSASDGSLVLWDTATNAELRRFVGHDDVVSAIAFHPAGQVALTGSWDRTMILWNIETGAVARRFTNVHDDRVLAVAFTPDGSQVLSGDNSGHIALWDLNNAEVLREFPGTDSAVTGIAVIPNGQSFLTSSVDGALYHWNIETGALIRRFIGHRSGVLTVDISPDGTTAISGSRDRSLILWDIASGEQIYRFEGHEDAVTSVTFTPDGLSAISGSRDRTLREWRTLSLGQLIGWTYSNRYVPDLDCANQFQARIDALCGDVEIETIGRIQTPVFEAE